MAGSQKQDGPQLADNRDFRLLWLGQGLSQVGTQITVVALPLLAVVTLGGTPLQVSGLVAVEYLPSLVLGLLAGLLVDRMERRSVMLVATSAASCCSRPSPARRSPTSSTSLCSTC